MTVTARLPKRSLREFTDRCRRGRGRVVRWLVVAIGLTVAGFAAIAAAAAPSIDTIVVMLSSSPGSSGAMSKSDSDALAGSLRSQFSIVGRTREGAYVLQLQAPLPLDGARAAVNRVRLIPQVVYANVVGPPSAVDPAAAKAAAAAHPPVERIIVKYRDQGLTSAAIGNAPLGAPAVARLGTLAGQPVTAQRAMSGGEYLVRLFQSLPVGQAAALARSIATDPAIEYAVPDLRMLPTLVPNDPLYPSQWHYMSPPAEMGGVNLPPAWDITTGSASIVIAVIDTGSLPNHPDLANRYVGGYDFVTDARIANDGGGRDPNAADPGDWVTSAEAAAGFFAGCAVTNSSFHGTHVAGTIGAATNNATGVAGINWVSKILPVRVLGKCGGYTSDIVDAIRWAVGLPVPGLPANPNPARVLNMSFGGYACNGGVCECDAASQSAIDDAVAAGAVPVVAAGNSNRPAIESSPGNCNGVITVAATGRQGQRASYSNYGPLIEIAAPGGGGGAGVLSTLNSGTTSPSPSGYNYVAYQGTSMAAPHVAGIVSLMLSVNPALTPSQVTSKLSTSARAFPVGTTSDCTTALCGAGIVDAAAAVLAAGGTTQPSASCAPEIVIDNLAPGVAGASGGGDVSFNGNWLQSGSTGWFGGNGSLFSADDPSVPDSYTWRTAVLNPTQSCTYSVYVWWTMHVNRSTSVPITVSGQTSAASTRSFNEQANGSQWVLHGTYSFAPGARATVQVSNATGQAAADAVRLVLVSSAPTITTLATSATPVVAGTPLTLTATVSGNAPSGSVTFTEGGNAIGCPAATLSVGNPSSASCQISSLAVGTHSIVANYGGDAANAASSSPALSQVINPAPDITPPSNVSGVSVSDAASGGRLNLSWVNPATDFAGVLILRRAGAAVSDAPATGQSYSAGQTLGASSVVYSGAAASYADLNLANGTTYFYKLFAYDAARNYASGASGSATPTAPVASCAPEIVIDNLAPGVAGASGGGDVSFSGNWLQSGSTGWFGGNGSLFSADDPSVPDSYTWRTAVLNPTQSCTYSVYVWWTMHVNRSTSVPITVSGQTSAASTRSFNEQANGSQWVLHGTYSFAPGARATVQVSNATGQAAADAVRLVLVSSAPTITTLATSATPVVAGTPLTLTATVSGNAPSGSVTFTEGGNAIGCPAATLSVGNPSSASCQISSLAVGTHSIVANYGGDAANAASSSPALSQVINPAPDITPPSNVSGVSVSDAASGGRLNLSWVNPATDFAGVLILRRAGAAVSDAPATGQSYSAGQTLGASSVVYSGAAASYADLNLANGTTYFYKLFAYDAARNYASGASGSATPTAPVASCAPEIVIDNLAPGVAGASGGGDVSFSGNWLQSGSTGWFGGNGSLFSADDPSVPDSYTWRTAVLNPTQSCTYSVYVWWTMHVNRSTSVPITVSGQTSAASTRSFNEQANGSQWVLHGTYSFAPGARATVQVSNATGQAAADAVRLVLVSSAPTPNVTLQTVASGLALPVDIAHAGDGSGRLFVVEQDGRIRIVSGGQLLPAPFLDIFPLLVTSGSEQGLLGVAFHPSYAANGYFFVDYTRQSDGATVIARYKRSNTDPNVADPASATVLLTIAQPYGNHNGGGLRFGPDGMLYIGMGDGGSANDPENRAQNLGTLLGKMLRINVNNPSPPYYSIPAGNPFQNEIWAYGLRNPWRFSFDRATGDLFIADVGQGAWEEIDFQPAGMGAGANYGWRITEGAHCTGLGGICPDASLTPPVLEYGHTLGCSVTGGYSYHGSASPALAGYYLYGDFCSGRIWGATRNAGGAWQAVELKSTGLNISTFGEDQAGELYVASYSTGVIYRISAD